MARKDRPIHGLKKVPNKVFTDIISNEIKVLKFQIGTLESYIAELEYFKNRYEQKFKPDFKSSELYKDMRNQINNLEEKLKKVNRDNETLILNMAKIHGNEKKY